jgi:hypothetical protein
VPISSGNASTNVIGGSSGSLPAQGTMGDPVDAQQLMQQLSEHVYALTVKTIMRGVRGVKLAHMLLGLLFTVVLQLGLLCLLWYMVTHPTDSISKDTEKVWMQMGQLQGQLCWMQAALNKSGIDVSFDGQADCAGAWTQPHEASFLSLNYTYCPGVTADELPTWEEARQCLHHDIARYWRRIVDPPDASGNTTVYQHCRSVFEAVGPELAAYGQGLGFPRVNKYTFVFPGPLEGSCAQTGALKSRARASPLVTRLVGGGWVMQGNVCEHSNDTQLHQVNVASYAECIAPLKYAWAVKPDITTLVVNLLAVMAVAVFVRDEVRRAATLCHTAAAVAGILPAFYTMSSSEGLCKSHLHWWQCLVVLCAPVLQLIIALLVLLSASMLSITQEMQASSIQVVLNSVALGYILEIDNKVGQMVAAQQHHWTTDHRVSSSLASGAFGHGSRLTSCLGHVYFSVVGLFLTVEPALLAPHAAVAVVVVSALQIMASSDKAANEFEFQ